MLVCRLYGDKRHFIRPAQITGKNGHILGLMKPFFLELHVIISQFPVWN